MECGSNGCMYCTAKPIRPAYDFLSLTLYEPVQCIICTYFAKLHYCMDDVDTVCYKQPVVYNVGGKNITSSAIFQVT
jgi:hypothetical protein